VKYDRANHDTAVAYYLPFDQDANPGPRQFLLVRTAGAARALGETLRRESEAIEAGVVVSQVQTIEQEVWESAAQPRFRATLLGGFAVVALLLSAVGIYGVIAYSVSQRTQEIGVRMALGAESSDVLALVMRQGAIMTAVGIAIGLLGATALSNLIAGMLFSVHASDPLTFVAVALLLGAVSLIATFLPALRATRIDPLAALRWE
jgi:putative ABC transport system permease protein